MWEKMHEDVCSSIINTEKLMLQQTGLFVLSHVLNVFRLKNFQHDFEFNPAYKHLCKLNV